MLVMGAGYVGLVTAACFAERGHEVVCFDIDPEKIRELCRGHVQIFEPDLENLVRSNLAKKHLTFTSTFSKELFSAFIIIIAVPTPQSDTGEANLTYIDKAAEQIGKNLDTPSIVIVKSTVPIGTTDRLHAIIEKGMRDRGIQENISTLSNPEFLREGSAVYDFLNPDRVIIGTRNAHAASLVKQLYRSFVKTEEELIHVDPITSELIKYASNSFLATKISFMNEIATIADQAGANVKDVKRGMSHDPRIGPEFLNAGIGYGGSCLPKDVNALIHQAQSLGAPSPLLKAVNAVNQGQVERFVEKIALIKAKTLTIFGLAFKPNTNDLRSSQSIAIIHRLLARGYNLKLFDPIALNDAKDLLPVSNLLTYCDDAYSATQQSDALLLLTEWDHFLTLDYSHILTLMNTPFIFDGRNALDPLHLTSLGFTYHGIANNPLPKRTYHPKLA